LSKWDLWISRLYFSLTQLEYDQILQMNSTELSHFLLTPQIGVKNGLNPLSDEFILYDDDDIPNSKQTQQHYGLLNDSQLFPNTDLNYDHEEKSINIDVGDILNGIDLGWELQKLINGSSCSIAPATDLPLSLQSIKEEESSCSTAMLDEWIPDDICVGQECIIGIPSPTTAQYDTDNTTSVSSASPSIISDIRTSTDSFINDSILPIKKRRHRRGLTQPEKKQRKKLQNKTAAEKYRLRKKLEKQTIQDIKSQLINNNKELQLEVDNLEYRIIQLKHLFYDIFPIKEEQQNNGNL
ncbi:unnamed protein product, partial [Didymodactylos carnosus]